MRRVLPVVFCTASLAASATAQSPSPSPGPPQPGPEHKRLGYFAGKWTTEGELKPGLFGPGGKTTGSESCEWFTGGFHLVCHAEGSSTMGTFKGLSVMGWNAEEKTYTHDAYNSMGMSDHSRGTAAGDTWTWTSETRMGGKAIKGRFTVKELGATSYSFKWEASVDGAPMAVLMEGKGTKAN